MPFLALGVEHTTAPLSVREALVMDREAAAVGLRHLIAVEGIVEVAVLSTCNRTEIYLFADDPTAGREAAGAYLSRDDEALSGHLRCWDDMAAVEHLFRVAGGLESQVLGERQILGQVRDAYRTAEEAGTVGPNLHALFRAAISCARQARAGTTLGTIDPSLGAEAVTVAARALDGLAGRSAVVVGGGEMARLVLEKLRSAGAGPLFVANRTESVAVDLGKALGATPARLTDLPRLLPRVDLVLCATAARHYVLNADDFPAEGFPARELPLQIIDLGMPRDVDPAVGDIPGVALHDLESLLPAGPTGEWEADVRHIEGIVAAEVREFMAWYLTRRAAPVIAHLRSHVEHVKDAELKRIAPQLATMTERERAAVESLTARLIDKMFHHLVVRLRLAAQTDPNLVEAAEFFFLHGEGGLFDYAPQPEAVDEEAAR